MTNTTTTTYIGNLKRDFDANMVSLELCATQQIPTRVHTSKMGPYNLKKHLSFLFLNYLVMSKKWDIYFFNFCGLLRMTELYMLWSIFSTFNPSITNLLTALKLYLIMFKLQLKNIHGSIVRCKHTAVQCNLVHQKYDTPNNIQILKKIIIK